MKKTFLLLIWQLISYTVHAQIITTIAGNGSSAYNGDNILATFAGLGSGGYITFDRNNNLYVVCIGQNRLRKIDAITGIITTVAGTGFAGYNGDSILATSAQLNNPGGVVVDTFGNIFISDAANRRIRKINAITGTIVTIAGTGIAGFSGDNGLAINSQVYDPIGLSIDMHNNLYVSDQASHQVRKISPSGIITTVAGVGGIPGFMGDNGLASSALLKSPQQTTSDDSGNIYIADQGNVRVRKVFANTGTIETYVGNGSNIYNGDSIVATSATINWARSVVFQQSTKNLYIADFYNRRIRKVDSFGYIFTIAGNGTCGFTGDSGLATLAEICLPNSVAMDCCGNLLFYDGANSRIRKVWFNTDTMPQVNVAIAPNDTVITGTQVTTTASATNHGTITSYHWVKNGANASTTNSYTYIPTNGDSLYCIVTTRACTGRTYTDTTQVMHITVTGDAGIASTKNYRTHTYPNPVTDVLHVATTEPQQYVLHNLMGVAILQGTVDKNNSIDMKAISSGIYLLQLTNTQGQREVVRVVKE